MVRGSLVRLLSRLGLNLTVHEVNLTSRWIYDGLFVQLYVRKTIRTIPAEDFDSIHFDQVMMILTPQRYSVIAL